MAEKTIKLASFWYLGEGGVERTAIRGDKVDITEESDLKRGERLGAFATDEDLEPGSDFADFLLRRGQVPTTEPGSIEPETPDSVAKPAAPKPAPAKAKA